MAEMFYSKKIPKGILNPGGDCKLDSNHWTVDCTVVMGLELRERSSSTQFFFVFIILLLKQCKKCMNREEIDWQKKNRKNPEGEVNKPSSLRDEHNIGAL